MMHVLIEQECWDRAKEIKWYRLGGCRNFHVRDNSLYSIRLLCFRQCGDLRMGEYERI